MKATSQLGNGEEFDGESLGLFHPRDFDPTLLPLVYAGANGNISSAFCSPDSLKDVEGKVVLNHHLITPKFNLSEKKKKKKSNFNIYSIFQLLCERGGETGRIDKGKVVALACCHDSHEPKVRWL
jgi:hypothetical protein